jgi:hypothetical protein
MEDSFGSTGKNVPTIVLERKTAPRARIGVHERERSRVVHSHDALYSRRVPIPKGLIICPTRPAALQ